MKYRKNLQLLKGMVLMKIEIHHERHFTSELEKVGHKFSEDMLLVCERFKLIDVLK